MHRVYRIATPSQRVCAVDVERSDQRYHPLLVLRIVLDTTMRQPCCQRLQDV